jgi:predicted alpha/beta hydrolase family esterase
MPGSAAGGDSMPALIVPGIGNSGPQHWQTLWERQHPAWQRVQQRDWEHPVCEEWVRRLDEAIGLLTMPPVLIAHSLGCLVVAHWAHRSSAPVRAAFLVAVPDPDGAFFPAAAEGFQSVPTTTFQFPSLVVASSDDSFGSVAHAKRCAAGWASSLVEIGAAGHINADSGLGDWPVGRALLDDLLKSL